MAQKDKVKELVGRGLDSYHTKALQQVDRIEKKNKEQNHKISILSNELDNDYLTKTEEGSVVSLEHSKEGMVYLDELQGNTLVNYCTDGSKELTLNGDIDVEGTFVTTTEGVDNGKVDVMCEGNTLVSHINYVRVNGSENNPFELGKNIVIKEYNSGYWLVSTPARDKDILYFRLDFTKISHSEEFDGYFGTNRGLGGYAQMVLNKDEIKAMANNTSKVISAIRVVDGRHFTESEHIHCLSINTGLRDKINDLFVFKVNNHVVYNLTQLFGAGNEPTQEWCDKNLPYIEGMKSVGELEDNKIEILSRNKNIWDISKAKKQDGSNFQYTTDNNTHTLSQVGDYGIYVPFYARAGQVLNIKGRVFNVQNIRIFKESDNFKGAGIANRDFVGVDTTIDNFKMVTFPEDGIYHFRIWAKRSGNAELTELMAGLDCEFNDYLPHKSNKKEILINEPLRKGNTEVKDRIIKLNNKWYVERNYEEIVLDGSYDWKINGNGTIYYNTTIFSGNKYVLPTLNNKVGNIVCDKRIVTYIDYIYAKEPNSVIGYIGITKDGNLGMSLDNKTPEQIKAELTSNPIRVILQLKTPVYEPLEVEPVLNTYNDITHIYNNSTIPCNMQVKNSGYNAIIKPSTQYTVALDTNKSGTIGMNLGGMKTVTTNNVATITTPAILSDDSLRLFGKGIKGSKIRLLEGDKTNWIPSHFEGMKSSFEDKFDVTDNTYKMEILMNNENLFDSTKTPDYTGGDMRYYIGYGGLFKRIENKEYILNNYGGMAFKLNLPKNKTYKISIKVRNSNGSNTEIRSAIFLNENMIGNRVATFTTNTNENVIGIGVVNYNEDVDLIVYDVILTEIVDASRAREYNKIQFSSIEPLRGVGDVKDKFVFKDGKLMVERNCSSVTFDGSDNEGWFLTSNPSTNTTRFRINVVPKCYGSLSGYCDKFKVLANTNQIDMESIFLGDAFTVRILNSKLQTQDVAGFKQWLLENPTTVTYQLAEPTYEEVPFELQKIILEGYENGTLFFDTNIPPTSTVTYAGETPIVKSVKLNKTEVLNNTNDINDNIIPYLMDMDYRVVCLQLATEEIEGGVSMARLFGGAYEMLKRDILSKRLTREEYGYRLADYFNAGKLTEEQVRELEELR